MAGFSMQRPAVDGLLAAKTRLRVSRYCFRSRPQCLIASLERGEFATGEDIRAVRSDESRGNMR
jgi:hypothetical protein